MLCMFIIPIQDFYECVVKGEESILHVFLGDDEEELGDYAMQCGNMYSCINALFRIKEITRDDDFLHKASSTTQGKQIFKGAIWNSDNKTVVPYSPKFGFFREG